MNIHVERYTTQHHTKSFVKNLELEYMHSFHLKIKMMMMMMMMILLLL